MVKKRSLRTYLGTAPGVGKTYAMLAEGQRRAGAGRRVVVGWIEHKGRPATRTQLGDLALVPPREIEFRVSSYPDLDLDAVLSGGADVVLVDELAHSTPDGNRRRWQDVNDLLDAGLEVMTTLNAANLRSLRDYVARITGVGAVESVPDELVRSGEVVLLDLPAEALRRRIASGAVFSAEQVGGALGGYFRASNLEALSELARAWIDGVAEAVGEQLLVRQGLAEPLEQPLVLAGDSGSQAGEEVIRRAAQLAREEDAELVVVHVDTSEPILRRRRVESLEAHRDLTSRLGGSYLEINNESQAEGLAETARARHASVVVVASPRSRLRRLARGSLVARLRRLLPDTTVEEVRNLAGGMPPTGRPTGRRQG